MTSLFAFGDATCQALAQAHGTPCFAYSSAAATKQFTSLRQVLPSRVRLAFALKLRDEAKVVLIPGLAFGEGGRRHARLSFAATPDQLREGVRRLAPYWNPEPAR